MTGETQSDPRYTKRASDTRRSMVVASASENVIQSFGRKRSAFQTGSGSTLYTAPESTRKLTVRDGRARPTGETCMRTTVRPTQRR